MKKEIIDSFKQLRYILYKNKYLIPQKPFPGPKLRLCAIKNPMNIIEKYFPQLKTEDNLRRYNNNKQQLIKLIEPQIKLQQQEYKRKKQQYQKNYIDALKPPGTSLKPQLVFYQEKKFQLFPQKSQKGNKSMKAINQMYQKLSLEEQKRYEKTTQIMRAQKMRILNQARAKYMVPQKQFVDPHILFLREFKEETFTPNDYHLFGRLNEQQKLKYKLMSLQLQYSDRKNLQAFVESRGLTYDSFLHIQAICKKYYDYEKLTKKIKNIKDLTNTIEAQQTQNNTQQSEQE